MENKESKLARSAAISAFLAAAITLYLLIKQNRWYDVGTIYLVSGLATVASLVFLGCVVSRNKNDTTLKTGLVLFGIAAANMPGIVLLIMIFLRNKYRSLKKFWYAPFLLQLLITALQMSRNLSDVFLEGGFFGMMTILQPVAYAMLLFTLGKWALNDLSDRQDAAKDTEKKYFDDLLSRGVLSREEYDKKVSEIDAKYSGKQ